MSETIITEETRKLATQRVVSFNRFRSHVEDLMRTVEPLEPDEFFELTDGVFTPTLAKYWLAYKRGRETAISQSVDEVFRQAIVGARQGGFDGGIDRAIRWARTWALFTDALARALNEFDVDLDRGDDSFGDLCDSLPIAGRRTYDAVLNDEVGSARQLGDVVRSHLKSLFPLKPMYSDNLLRCVMRGENYVRAAIDSVTAARICSQAAHPECAEDYEPPHHVAYQRLVHAGRAIENAERACAADLPKHIAETKRLVGEALRELYPHSLTLIEEDM